MRRSTAHFALFTAALTAAFITVTSCDDGTAPEPEPEPDPVPASVTIAPTAVSVVIGGSAQLTATVRDQYGDVMAVLPAGTALTWESSEPDLVEVDESGLATGLAPGTVSITARVGSAEATVEATVLAPELELDAGSAATVRIPPTGGAIEAQSAGVQYRLDIPLGALLDTTDITMTPVSAIGNSPFEALLGAVSFGPDGLTLLEPATLTITLPAAAPEGTVFIEMSDDGSEFGYALGSEADNVLTTAVAHFSAGGAVRIDPNDPPRATHSSLERQALSAIVAEFAAAVAESRPFDLAVAVFWMTDWYALEIQDGLTAAAQAESAFKKGISAWRYWLKVIEDYLVTGLDLGEPLRQALQSGIEDSHQRAAAALSAQIGRSIDDCFDRQNTVPTKDVFYIQYAAERWDLVGRDNTLEADNVKGRLCPRVVFPSLTLSDPLVEGEDAELNVTVGVTFDRSGTGSIRTGPQWPIDLDVSLLGTTTDALVQPLAVDNQGHASRELVPSGTGSVTAEVEACMNVHVTQPPMLDFSDICAFGGLTRPVETTWKPYFEDFDGAAGPEWSNQQIATSPSGQRFLGLLNSESVTLTLSDLPAHQEVVIEFDLHVIGSWDGNGNYPGGDYLRFRSGSLDFLATFSNDDGDEQAYPQAYPASNPRGTGALSVNTLGYSFSSDESDWEDSTYRVSFTISHALTTFSFTVTGTMTSTGDEFWGIDNVRVKVQ